MYHLFLNTGTALNLLPYLVKSIIWLHLREATIYFFWFDMNILLITGTFLSTCTCIFFPGRTYFSEEREIFRHNWEPWKSQDYSNWLSHKKNIFFWPKRWSLKTDFNLADYILREMFWLYGDCSLLKVVHPACGAYALTFVHTEPLQTLSVIVQGDFTADTTHGRTWTEIVQPAGHTPT